MLIPLTFAWIVALGAVIVGLKIARGMRHRSEVSEMTMKSCFGSNRENTLSEGAGLEAADVETCRLPQAYNKDQAP